MQLLKRACSIVCLAFGGKNDNDVFAYGGPPRRMLMVVFLDGPASDASLDRPALMHIIESKRRAVVCGG